MIISKKYQLILDVEITQEIDFTEQELGEFLEHYFCNTYCSPKKNRLKKYEMEGNEIVIGENITWKEI
jgi:hypothetical protein